MIRIKALQNTIIKKSTEDSSKLPADQKVSVNKGRTFVVREILDFNINNHYHIRLEYGAGDWYFFRNHFELVDDNRKTISNNGIALLHEFEGLRLTAYLCPARVWTIGWGNTRYEDGSPVKQGDTITKARADRLFLNILKRFEDAVNDLVKVDLNQNQFDALVSFVYNVGVEAFRTSTLLRKLNNKDYMGAYNEFPRWNRGGGRVLAGLTRRRAAEAQLFIKNGVSNVRIYPNLEIPYISQRKNKRDPAKTCGVTCVAMALQFYNIKQRTNHRYPDELDFYMANKGWNRYLHSDLVKLMADYGLRSVFSTTTSWDDVKKHLDSGNPVIVSGKFTNSGHIIMLRGYDNSGFWVNDPWGEFFHTGYRADKSGENKKYSYQLMYNTSYGGSQNTWAHLITRI